MMTYKDVICKGYCKNYGANKEICKTCGDFCKNFQQSDFANFMVGEELMEGVAVIYRRYLEAQIKEFEENKKDEVRTGNA